MSGSGKPVAGFRPLFPWWPSHSRRGSESVLRTRIVLFVRRQQFRNDVFEGGSPALADHQDRDAAVPEVLLERKGLLLRGEERLESVADAIGWVVRGQTAAEEDARRRWIERRSREFVHVTRARFEADVHDFADPQAVLRPREGALRKGPEFVAEPGVVAPEHRAGIDGHSPDAHLCPGPEGEGGVDDHSHQHDELECNRGAGAHGDFPSGHGRISRPCRVFQYLAAPRSSTANARNRTAPPT